MKTNKNVSRMIKYFFRSKKATIYACIMCALGLAVGVVTPICNKLIQEDIIPNKNISLFIWLTILILVLNLVSTMTSFLTTRIFINNGVPITANIRCDIVKMNTLSAKNKSKTGKVLISSTSFLEEANTYYISYMYLIFDCILKFMFYFPFFLIYGGYLAIIMVAIVVIYFGLLEVIEIFVKKNSDLCKKVDADRYDYTLKLINEMQKKDFKEDEIYNLQTYMQKVKACDKAWIVYCNYANLYSILFNIVWYLGVACCLCLSHGLIGSGAVLVSTTIVFNSYLDQLKGPIESLVSYKQVTDNYDQTFKNIFEFLDDSDLQQIKYEKD